MDIINRMFENCMLCVEERSSKCKLLVEKLAWRRCYINSVLGSVFLLGACLLIDVAGIRTVLCGMLVPTQSLSKQSVTSGYIYSAFHSVFKAMSVVVLVGVVSICQRATFGAQDDCTSAKQFSEAIRPCDSVKSCETVKPDSIRPSDSETPVHIGAQIPDVECVIPPSNAISESFSDMKTCLAENASDNICEGCDDKEIVVDNHGLNKEKTVSNLQKCESTPNLPNSDGNIPLTLPVASLRNEDTTYLDIPGCSHSRHDSGTQTDPLTPAVACDVTSVYESRDVYTMTEESVDWCHTEQVQDDVGQEEVKAEQGGQGHGKGHGQGHGQGHDRVEVKDESSMTDGWESRDTGVNTEPYCLKHLKHCGTNTSGPFLKKLRHAKKIMLETKTKLCADTKENLAPWRELMARYKGKISALSHHLHTKDQMIGLTAAARRCLQDEVKVMSCCVRSSHDNLQGQVSKNVKLTVDMEAGRYTAVSLAGQ